MRALIIYRDIMPALETLDDQQLGALTRAALALVQDRNEPPDDPMLAFAWTVVREKILEQGQKYDEAADARAERARRARAAQADASRRKPTRASHYKTKRNKTKLLAMTPNHRERHPPQLRKRQHCPVFAENRAKTGRKQPQNHQNRMSITCR